MNRLYFGDNLTVLKDHIKDGSADLIYLDPPFKSDVNYNVLFKGEDGEGSDAQVEAFRDTWKWGDVAGDAYEDVMEWGGETALVLKGLRSWLGANGMMAYLSMMTIRLLHLREKLADSGSLYLHCDSNAGHYLKLVLDSVFGHKAFRNDISWCYRKWSVGARQFARNHDDILFYTKGDKWTFNVQFVEPSAGTHKRWGGKKQQALFDDFGRRLASSLEEEARSPCPDWWDISIINPNAKERLGYPTQKPLALLDRIIKASSNEGDLVLDPFCGCGTSVDAAESLRRQWVGIDVTHYAVTLIEERLNRLHKNAKYGIFGRPSDLAGAHALAAVDKHQFQWWAAWLLGVQSYREEKKGPDGGIDGRIFYRNGPYGTGQIVISVKSGENLGVEMLRSLDSVISREGAEMGILITLHEPTQGMIREAAQGGFVARSAHDRLPRLQVVTVADLLDRRFPKLPPLPRPVEQARPTRGPSSKQLEMLFDLSAETLEIPKKGYVDPRYMSFRDRQAAK